jgi:hypothetical protein
MEENMEKRVKKTFPLPALIGVFIGGALIGGLAAFGIYNLVNWGQEPATSNTEETPKEPEVPKEPEKPVISEIDFQPIVDEWAKSVSGNRSVLIYDLNLDKIVGSYNVDEDYGTASLYKLFVVYEGYKRLENGTWDGGAKAGSTGYTISKCLDLAIRESHSPCAETLWGMIGHDKLDTIIENEWGITHSDISRLTSNVGDIMAILKRFYEHPDFNDEGLLAAMWDSFLNQPDTTYEWRQGLPRGFSKANVYNKVGWAYNTAGKYWDIYHDAAIVKFPLEDGKTRDYIVVVMTNKIDYPDIRRFGTMLENRFYQSKE